MSSSDMEIASSEVDLTSTPVDSAIASKSKVQLSDVETIISYITKGVETNQTRLIQRALRYNSNIRKFISKAQLISIFNKYITVDNILYAAIDSSINKLPTTESVEEISTAITNTSTTYPEVEVYLITLLVTVLLREKLNIEAVYLSTLLIDKIRSYNRRSLDILASKAFFYYSLSYELINQLENIRGMLLVLYRTSCIHTDIQSQAVLINLILRNYLQYNLIIQANLFNQRITYPEAGSNNQFIRYLFYIGRIKAIQLEYSDSYARLTMALRKLHTSSSEDDAVIGLGFLINLTKLIIIVQLLMGEIPERSTFNQKSLRVALIPYFHLTQAVRQGNLQEYSLIIQKYKNLFIKDKYYMLIKRLGHNVLKIGLKKISISYSRISLADIAVKLHLPSALSAEYICAKAIRDGVIDATIDPINGWLITTDNNDLYVTEEPLKEFHRRIVFCLDVHNDSVKSMRYPPDIYKKDNGNGADKSKDEEKSIEELIKELEDDLG